jgi:hypothetical protein
MYGVLILYKQGKKLDTKFIIIFNMALTTSTLVETVKTRFLIYLQDISKQNIINVYSAYKPPTTSAQTPTHNYSYSYASSPVEIYKSLPERFVSLAQWPHSCNLKCWHCDRMFNTRPLFIPDEPWADGSFGVKGVFGDWPCMARFINDNYPEQKYVYNSLMLQLYYIFTGIRIEKIPLAPPKTIMKQYCGESGVSLSEYDEIVKSLLSHGYQMAKTSTIRKLE